MTQVTQLFLLVTDIAQSRRFYENVLGLKPSTIGDSSIGYETGNCELKLQSDFDEGVLEQYNLSSPPAVDRGAGAIFVLEVEEPLRDIYRRVNQTFTNTGGESLIEPRSVQWNGRIFLIKDPDGYIYEIRANK